MKKSYLVLPALILILLNCVSTSEPAGQIFIRCSQTGYLSADQKIALILSQRDITGGKFEVVNQEKETAVYSSVIPQSSGKYASLNFSYAVDFSNVTAAGRYYIAINGTKSYSFVIGNKVFNPLVDSLLAFYKIQRCGYTEPVMHGKCHIADATSLIDGKNIINKTFDVTGGWHDAGDYIKFLNTTAVTTYMLLFSYDFDPGKFGFDRNGNGIPDILEEAKIGLDWLLRCNYTPGKLITQVQNLRDHDTGWRMPENDNLQFDRPAFLGFGKNLIGIYSAALALASKIWREKIKYYEFADKCISTAEAVYSRKDSSPDVDSSGTGHYVDKEFEGKIALGAYELYSATRKQNYLNQAMVFAEKAGPDYWWSWGNINSIVHYRLSQFDKKFITFIEKNLTQFSETSKGNVFETGAAATWGTNNTLLGITLQNILWKRITGSSRFDRLALTQRDYILGRNPWGISFIYKTGSEYVKNLHHQIAYLNGGRLTGGFAAGPAKKEYVLNQKLKYEKNDIYSMFQTDDYYYRDDRVDYITNEPTITANATAIFVFGYFTR